MLVLTEWNEFRDLDFARIFNGMHKPAWIFDGRNVLVDMAKLRSLGFYVYSIGKPESI
jgi:UDPglucose 6-dehydrogenase